MMLPCLTRSAESEVRDANRVLMLVREVETSLTPGREEIDSWNVRLKTW